jgi:hypothetical protein
MTSHEAETLAVTAAMRFAEDRLLSAKHRDFLERNPVLHKSLVARVCGVITPPDSKANFSTSTLPNLVGCQVNNQTNDTILRHMMSAADDPDQEGNSPPEAFEEMLAELRNRLADKDQAAVDVLRKLLIDLSVGYVNVRSETFFAEKRRVLLRGPYAHLLKTAGFFLSEKERSELRNKTKIILESPEMQEHASRIRCDHEKVLDDFIDWVPTHRSILAHVHASENAAVSD